MQTRALPPTLEAHIQAVNAHDTDAVMATFAAHAFVNDARREFFGAGSVREWIEREVVGDNVTYALVEALEDHGDWILRLRTEGDYDKTDLPDPLILTVYAKVGPEGIERLIIILNRESVR